MSVINTQPLIGASGNQGGAYNLTRSLRFRSSATASLTRTPASAGNRQTWTWSGWVKRGVLSSRQGIFTSSNSAGDDYTGLEFIANDKLAFIANDGSGSEQFRLETNAVFRDPAAWYHIVVFFNTTQTTAANRAAIYVNNVLQTYSTATYMPQNYNGRINNTNQHNIGNFQPSNAFDFDGYISEVNFIDGQALTPSDFGETSTTTGVWIPKAYTGTYGTNGFYLDFEDTSSVAALGYDAAGSNDWTVNNVSLTGGATYDSMTDVPTLTSATAANYCVINAAHPPVTNGGTYSITNANLSASAAGATKWMSTVGTFPMHLGSGKWYFEFLAQQNGVDHEYGVGLFNVANGNLTNAVFFDQAGGVGYSSSGQKVNSGSYSAYGTSWGANGDIIGVAIDASGATTSVQFYKNNTSQGVAFSGLTGTYVPAFGNAGSQGFFSVNFGQRPFAYTPPTGFVALNTFNLPTPTIGATASSQANKYFDVVTRNGFGSSGGSVTSLNFQPDLWWEKARSTTSAHYLEDSVRGVTKYLSSNSTAAETTDTTFLTSFNSNGYTMGSGDFTTGTTLVDWVWKAGGTGVSNTAGSITSTVSANTSAGFSVVTYTGTGANATVGHGLGVAPRMIICKNRTTGGASGEWQVLHQAANGGSGHLGAIFLNLTQAWSSGNYFGSTQPTSTVFSLDGSSYANQSGNNHVAYCFADVEGYSKFGSYTGNGSTDGVFVYTGFRPKFIMIKRTSGGTGSWAMYDTARNTFNVSDKEIAANESSSEYTRTEAHMDILSNGFKLRNTDNWHNVSGSDYIYMAVAENPFKYSLAR